MDHLTFTGPNIKRALRANLTFKVLSLPIGFLFQILVAKNAFPEEYATYAVLLAILVAGESVVSFGVNRSILRFVPSLTLRHDMGGLRSVLGQLAIIRVASLFIFVIAFWFGRSSINLLLWGDLTTQHTIIFGVWFSAYVMFSDLESLASSWMLQFYSAVIGMLEVLARFCLIGFIAFSGQPVTASIVITVYALTMTAAVAALSIRLVGAYRSLNGPSSIETKSEIDTTVDQTRVRAFAAANYASTLGWVIASPAVVRLIAATGLGAVALSAFSFAQGLCGSLQRGFPALLILPSLEPIIMLQSSRLTPREKIFSELSIIFKLDVICILGAVMVTSIAGFDIVKSLSRQVYAEYYYVLPVLFLLLTLSTMHRIFEIIANIAFGQAIFLWLWPLSVASALAIFVTVDAWGVLAVIIWPLVEGIIRICLLLLAFRRESAWRAFDPPRVLLIIFIAALAEAAALIIKVSFIPGAPLLVAMIAASIFIFAVLIIRPFRQAECESVLKMLPSSWSLPRRIAQMVTR